MIQFVEKHFKGAIAWWYKKLLQIIIAFKSLSGKTRNLESTIINREEKIYLTGDEAGIEEMWPIAIKAGKKISINANSTNVLVLCEGDSCSFKKIIEELQRASSKRYYVHAKDTGSAVGSHDKKCQGAIIS